MSKRKFSTSTAALEASLRLRARGYPDVTVKPRHMLNLEARGSVARWPRNASGHRELTDQHVDELVEYFAGYFGAHGVFPLDATATTDVEDRA